mmetsp:Transcript_50248/g.68346  ORF Transcript_50248/g.68346 Transcript_50248/m.68346 type:complete len:85 (+) Transcript_50248:38-292(+)
MVVREPSPLSAGNEVKYDHALSLAPSHFADICRASKSPGEEYMETAASAVPAEHDESPLAVGNPCGMGSPSCHAFVDNTRSSSW